MAQHRCNTPVLRRRLIENLGLSAGWEIGSVSSDLEAGLARAIRRMNGLRRVTQAEVA
jgi:hypothetical protein